MRKGAIITRRDEVVQWRLDQNSSLLTFAPKDDASVDEVASHKNSLLHDGDNLLAWQAISGTLRVSYAQTTCLY